ncbi:MAG: leucine-rich repeat domain-containing protein [Candidatus Helarchaeota archaeon]
MGYKIFISYATKDRDIFHILDLKYYLEKQQNIDHVFVWEKDIGIDIYDYMEKNIPKCDIMLTFCSTNYLNSKPCEKEWQAADRIGKQIVPIFIEITHVPLLLKNIMGVKIDIFKEPEENFKDILKEINRRIELLEKSKTTEKGTPTSKSVFQEKIHKKSLYRGKQVINEEIELLKKSQIEFGKILKDFDVDSNGSVIYLDLSNFEVNNIREIIKEFKNLSKINFQSSQFSDDKFLEDLLIEGIEIYLDGKKYEPGQIEKIKKTLEQKYGVNYQEALALHDIEKILGKSIPRVNEIKWNFFGFIVQNGIVTGLGLYNNELTTFPESILNLTNLQALDLSVNQLTTLPESFGNLKLLQVLSLNGNQLTTLPDSFGNLKSLQILDLSWNQLTTLPYSLGNLINLKRLDLLGNRLTTLPESFGNLKSLQVLCLNGNKLTTLPEFFGNLKLLQILHLFGIWLMSLPKSLCKLPNLKEIGVNGDMLGTKARSIIKKCKKKGIKINDPDERY